MTKEINIYRCNICGKIVIELETGDGIIKCCNKPMEFLKANTTDGAKEKHVPYLVKSNTQTIDVQVGKDIHVMTNEHYIQWIGSFSENEWIIKWLKPNNIPNVTFKNNKGAKIYEKCNLHGLWKK